jgi:hypothetical protein
MNSGLLTCTGEDGDYSIIIGDDGFGTINMNGGTWDLAYGIDFTTRDKGEYPVVTFNMNGGLVTIAEGGFATNTDEDDDRSGEANINVSGGEMYIGGDMELVKEPGRTNLTVTGGYLEVSGSIIAPDNDDGEALIDIGGGTLKAESLQVKENGVARLYGGTLQAGTLRVNEDGYAKLNGGTAELGALVIEDGGALDFYSGSVMVIDGDARDLIAELIAAGKWVTNEGRNDPDVVYDDVGDKTTITAPPVNWYQAWGPTPRNKTRYYTILDTCLTWKEGDDAFLQIMWFDEDYDAVNNADPYTQSPVIPPGRGFYGIGPAGKYCPESPPPGIVPVTMELWKTYYWRVDCIKPTVPQITVGNVWSFGTGCDLPEDVTMDCMVNFKDVAEMGAEWMEKVYWPPE